MLSPMISGLADLECPECRRHFDADRVQTICQECRSPLLANYDFAQLSQDLAPEVVSQRPRGIWRWAELLPVRQA